MIRLAKVAWLLTMLQKDHVVREAVHTASLRVEKERALTEYGERGHALMVHVQNGRNSIPLFASLRNWIMGAKLSICA